MWPNEKEFALTIIDDTDHSTIKNTKPVYDLMYNLGIGCTKTIWAKTPNESDKWWGYGIDNQEYKCWINNIKSKGFEIASHGISSGSHKRREYIKNFHDIINISNKNDIIHTNHATNKDNIYWGGDRFTKPIKHLYNLFKKRRFYGHKAGSKYFWGDIHKSNVRYTRNHTFKSVNTISSDPYMPYKVPSQEFSNYWFSSSDGADPEKFCQLLSPSNISKLIDESGAAIVYTHFGHRFCSDGKVREDVADCLIHISEQNGWFPNASTLLDYLSSECGRGEAINEYQRFMLDIMYVMGY